MRKVMMLLALTAGVAAQASEKNDTTVIENAKNVTIIANESTQEIKVVGKEGDSDYRYEHVIHLKDSNYCKRVGEKKELKLELDVALGVGTPTNAPDNYGFAPFKSMEFMVGLRHAYTPKNALQTYSVGLWFDWRLYGLGTDKQFAKNADGIIGLEEYLPKAEDKYSRISIFSLSVPFLFTQQFGRKSNVKLTLGPVVNFNVYGRIYNDYTLVDNDYSVGIKNIGYRPVTIDFMGAIDYDGFGLYCKYSPMSVLKSKSANGVENPQFHSLTFGLFF